MTRISYGEAKQRFPEAFVTHDFGEFADSSYEERAGHLVLTDGAYDTIIWMPEFNTWNKVDEVPLELYHEMWPQTEFHEGRHARVTVTKAAISEFVKEALDNKNMCSSLIPETYEDKIVTVNDVVDQSAQITDTKHPGSKPQNKAEFQVAVKAMVDDLPDDQVPSVYDKLKGALDIAKEKEQHDVKEKDMSEKDKVEEAVRLAVRKMVAEAWVKGPSGDEIWTDETPKKGKKAAPQAPTGKLPPVKKIPLGQRGGESQAWFEKGKKDLKKTFKLMHDDPADADDEELEAPAGKRTYKSTAIGGMADVAGTSFQDIAKELGFAVSGAKQAVDKALLKAQWVAKLDKEAPEELEILTLTAMNDYIKFLSKTGALSAADIQLMKDHPDIVRELSGFRQYLDKAIRKARKGSKLEDPLGED